MSSHKACLKNVCSLLAFCHFLFYTKPAMLSVISTVCFPLETWIGRGCCDPSAGELTEGTFQPLSSGEDAGRKSDLYTQDLFCVNILPRHLWSEGVQAVGIRWAVVSSDLCVLFSLELKILVCVSKCCESDCLERIFCCLFCGIICQWVVWYRVGLNSASCFLSCYEMQWGFCTRNLNRFFIIRFLCVCQAPGTATKMCVLCSGSQSWESV